MDMGLTVKAERNSCIAVETLWLLMLILLFETIDIWSYVDVYSESEHFYFFSLIAVFVFFFFFHHG